MNTTDNAREARSRNLARLRRLTIGTAALSVAATTGFGYLAAMTYTGTTTTGITTAYTTPASSATTAATTAATSSAPSTAGSTTSSAASAPTVTSTRSAAQVSTGGS